LASARPLSIGKPGTPPGEGRPAPAAPHFPGGQEGDPRIGYSWIFEAQAFALPVRRGRGKSGHHRVGFLPKGGAASGRRLADGKCRRKQTAPPRGVRVKRWGKSPPPGGQPKGHDKPNPVQGQQGPGDPPAVPGTLHPGIGRGAWPARAGLEE